MKNKNKEGIVVENESSSTEKSFDVFKKAYWRENLLDLIFPLIKKQATRSKYKNIE